MGDCADNFYLQHHNYTNLLNTDQGKRELVRVVNERWDDIMKGLDYFMERGDYWTNCPD